MPLVALPSRFSVRSNFRSSPVFLVRCENWKPSSRVHSLSAGAAGAGGASASASTASSSCSSSSSNSSSEAFSSIAGSSSRSSSSSSTGSSAAGAGAGAGAALGALLGPAPSLLGPAPPLEWLVAAAGAVRDLQPVLPRQAVLPQAHPRHEAHPQDAAHQEEEGCRGDEFLASAGNAGTHRRGRRRGCRGPMPGGVVVDAVAMRHTIAVCVPTSRGCVARGWVPATRGWVASDAQPLVALGGGGGQLIRALGALGVRTVCDAMTRRSESD